MKVRVEPQMEVFNPMEVVLTLESKEEAQAIFAIFNHTKNSSLLGRAKSSSITAAIGGVGRNNGGGVIANGVTYDDYYRQLIV